MAERPIKEGSDEPNNFADKRATLNHEAAKVMRREENGCFSKLWTSEMSRALQTSTVYFSHVSYLFECNANDTYVLRMTQHDLADAYCKGWRRRFAQVEHR